MERDRARQKRPSPAWRYRLLAWGVLGALVLVFFRGWFGDGLPISPRREVMAPFAYIWQTAEYLRQGYLYVDWDPSFFAGYAWLRFLQSTVYYLAALLSLAPGLSLAAALKVFTVGAYIVSAWTMCELVQQIVRRRGDSEAVAWAAGAVAGAAYALFPFHMRLGIEITSHAVFWAIMPLPFLAYERGRESTGLLARAAPLGVSMALYGMLDIEHALLVTPFVALYLLLREAPRWRGRVRQSGSMLVLSALIALGLAGFYIVPAIGEIGNVGISARFGEGGAADAQFARDTGLSSGALLAGIADRAGVTFRPPDLPYIVFGFFGANSWYVGVICLALAIAALPGLRRTPEAVAALVLLALAFAWAARAWLPFNPFGAIPFYGTLSGFRGMVHIAFLLSLLAGVGAAWLLSLLPRPDPIEQQGRGKPRRTALLLLALLAVAALFMDRPRPTVSYLGEVLAVTALLSLIVVLGRRDLARTLLAGLLLIVLIAIDFRTTSTAVASVPRYFADDEIAAYRWLTDQGEGFRIWEYSDLYDDAEFLHTFSIAYNQTPRFGGYYDNGATAYQWRLYKWAKPERGRSYDSAALRTALQVSAVRFVLVHRRVATFDEAIARLKQIGFAHVAWQTTNLTILEDRAWLPLARLYHKATPLAGDPGAELERLAQAHAAGEALCAGCTALRAAAPQALTPATVRRKGPYEVVVSVDAPSPGLLVLAESWHTNWRVSVDGQPVEPMRANVAFIGVHLDAGKHAVLYSYHPPAALPVGWLISGFTASTLAVWCTVGRRRR